MNKMMLAVVGVVLSSLGVVAQAPQQLPGEYTADQILNGEYQWPPSPAVEIQTMTDGFDAARLVAVPSPGVHPRILFSPSELPDIRRRGVETEVGRLALKTLRGWQSRTLHRRGTASHNVFEALVDGDIDRAAALYDDYADAGTPDGVSWHHRPQFLYILALEAFDCLIRDDPVQGARVATAVANLARIFQPRIEASRLLPLADDNWRTNGSDVPHGREAIGGEPYLGYLYDFTYNWMTDAQRDVVRRAIADYARGRVTMGSHMPHHFRRWNWVAVGQGLVLTALAIEGETGYDERVVRHCLELYTDFMTYGWSAMGSSREAVGYTQFGLTWGTPAMVAYARRGHNLITGRYRRSAFWYAHALQPYGGQFLSHGDGGRGHPKVMNMLAMKHFYPDDRLVDFVLQESIAAQNTGSDYLDGGRGYLLHQLIWAHDPEGVDYDDGLALGLEQTFFDPERNSLITRSDWSRDALCLQFEARADGIAANHQHADRGNFTLAGAGRLWAMDRFRGIESRHHNNVIIDGKGQGYFPTPATWLGLSDSDTATLAAADLKYAYDWAWPGTPPGFVDADEPRRQYPRWRRFAENADAFLASHPGFDAAAAIDRSPVVEAFYNGFESGDPRLWDEYGRPLRVPHNPVQKAIRSVALVRGPHPYALVVDDIRKDDAAHLYEWIMMTPNDVELAAITTDEILLCDTSTAIGTGTLRPRLAEGNPLLLVKVLDMAVPGDESTRPAIRLETFEYKDARDWPEGRTFGLAKRLVIPSLAVEPGYKVLLFPHRHGDPRPTITWDARRTSVTVAWDDQVDTIEFPRDDEGRTGVAVTRDGRTHQID